jgi:Helitron helicase-like domain at N-terminus
MHFEHVLSKFIVEKPCFDMLFCNICLDPFHNEYNNSFWAKEVLNSCPAHEPRDIYWAKEVLNSCPAYEPRDIYWAKEALNSCPTHEPQDIYWAKEAINSCPAHEPQDIYWAKEAINSCPAHEPQDFHWAKEALNSCPAHEPQDLKSENLNKLNHDNLNHDNKIKISNKLIHTNSTSSKILYCHFSFMKLYVMIILNLCNHLHYFSLVYNCIQQGLYVKLMLLQNLFCIYLTSSNIVPDLEHETYLYFIFIIGHYYIYKIFSYIWSKIYLFIVYIFLSDPVSHKSYICIGAGKPNVFSFDELKSYSLNSNMTSSTFRFKAYIPTQNVTLYFSDLHVNYPMNLLVPKLTIPKLRILAACHELYIHSKLSQEGIQDKLLKHKCIDCSQYTCIFESIVDENTFVKKKATNLKAVKKYQDKNFDQYKQTNLLAVHKYQTKDLNKWNEEHCHAMQRYRQQKKFPPQPPSQNLQLKIISDFCNDTSPNLFMEAGCAVCGQLTSLHLLQKLSVLELNLKVLENSEVTCKERFSMQEPIQSLGHVPVLLENLDNICFKCFKSISNRKRPVLSLANGLWIGNIPTELSNLSYAEQLLIARVRHNRCIVRVSSGMHKMTANAIMFANPTPKIYNILPPPVEELDEILAFIYTGPCKPTQADLERTPLLVRRNKVASALHWLKLNHCDYWDLEISETNLNQYPDNDIPVIIDYRQVAFNKNPESTAVYDHEIETGTETGQCPFVVHGLTGEEYSTKSLKAIKAIALQHLTSGKKVLAIGHGKNPLSIYDNAQLFPQMMPWLFPYGLGGIGNSMIQGKVSDIAHKRYLLMYHDKRFQKDPHFPLIAFNHEQMKEATTGGYLLASKSKFEQISQRVMDIDMNVLYQIAKKMKDGDRVMPITENEKLCFQILKDLDHVGAHVKGSLTNKKYMRNEIWSLISFYGAPSWFITFSSADNMHPISLYFADDKISFSPDLRTYDERYKLIAQNPVAGARFFHFICEMFIKHVLGVNTDHSGFYGKTNAYYGTVEQQGRLTLHLHMLIWIVSSLSPQQIRDKIMNPNSDFQCKIIDYLESVHVGEFLTGTLDEVKNKVTQLTTNISYKNPTEVLPLAPPTVCISHDVKSNDCNQCANLDIWWNQFNNTVDNIVLSTNVHNCARYSVNNEKVSRKDRPSCINKHGNCKARFPRSIHNTTHVDPLSGVLTMKKLEQWLNTFTPLVTYLLGCNTDVTSLLSGTAIKAVVAYISDYITKPDLKTYSIFDTIRCVIDKNSEIIGSSISRKEKARKLMTKMINALTAKLEIGGPMASLYLLGNPDHYTNMKFITFYWKIYVNEVLKAWNFDDNMHMESELEKLVLYKANNTYVGTSQVDDYIYRSEIYAKVNLYEKKIQDTCQSIFKKM